MRDWSFTNPKFAAIIALIFILGVLAGGATIYLWRTVIAPPNAQCLKMYPLTNSTLNCDQYEQSSQTLENIDATLTSAAAVYIQQGKATRISVWVRDFNTSQTASVDENDVFAPASLLKVPLMIAYYKLAEIEPSILSDQLVYASSTAPDSQDQVYPPTQVLTVGQSYSVETLIEHMIVYSDNNAADLLAAHMDPGIFSNTLVDLGIEIPVGTNTNTTDFITVKTYSAIFRNLYNANYLNRLYSQKALSLLAQSTFQGISEPLPQGIIVADKFAERGVDQNGVTVTRELHDCGIVYKSGAPYSICIMTEGTDDSVLLSIIRDISKVTYQML